jgi:hypothetical protein
VVVIYIEDPLGIGYRIIFLVEPRFTCKFGGVIYGICSICLEYVVFGVIFACGLWYHNNWMQ